MLQQLGNMSINGIIELMKDFYMHRLIYSEYSYIVSFREKNYLHYLLLLVYYII